MKARALVFDFDGLLLETEGPAYQAWSEVYREHGHELPRERWLTTVGGAQPTTAVAEGGGHIGREGSWFDALGHLGELVGAGFDREAVHARREARKTELIQVLEVMPGVRERIAEARERDMKVGVASSSTLRWVGGHLERLALRSMFDAVTCREDGMRAKPAPDIYLAAVAALGVAPSEAVAIEDSANGIAAAKAAGLRCVVVPNALTAQQDLSAADVRVASLADLTLDELLARLAA